MSQSNELMSAGAQLIGMPLAGPESFSAEQLAYLKRALGVDETVLFNGTAAVSVTCSENITNFERLKVYVAPAAVADTTMIQIVEMIPGKFGAYMMMAGYTSNLFHIYGGRIANSGTTTVKTENGFHMWVPITSGGTVGNESSNSKIVKIIGVHRIAGGN